MFRRLDRCMEGPRSKTAYGEGMTEVEGATMGKRTNRRSRAVPVLGLALALGLAACSSPSGPELAGPQEVAGAVLMTHDGFFNQGSTNVGMDALFEGDVARDEEGCLRIASADRHTVIWPAGYRLTERDGNLVVLDAEGQAAGTVGGTFRLGGGEAETLHEDLRVSDAVRETATERCPGRYWIVSPGS